MEARSKIIRPEMGFQCISLLDESLPLQQEDYDVILDKGTLDAIYPPSLKDDKIVHTFFTNMDKLLKLNGKYIIISLL